MKKSVEILGLPIISITEGRELGVSKSLLIDAKNGQVAAITIEDDDWYRGVKLIPYEAVIAIGEDAVTINHSENILNLDEAGDYERLLVENIRVIGTKAITKTGRIQGKITEVLIGDGGKIEKCEITAPNGEINEVTADQVSIFGKQVTVVDIDTEKKNNFVTETPPVFQPAIEAVQEEPAQDVWTPAESNEELGTSTNEELGIRNEELQGDSAQVEDVLEMPEVPAQVEDILETPVEPAQVEEILEQPVEPAQVEEILEQPVEPAQVEEILEQPVEPAQVEEILEQPVEPAQVEEILEQPVEPAQVEEILEQPAEPVVEPAQPEQSEEDKRLAAMTQQAEELKKALKKARDTKATPAEPRTPQKKQVEKAVDDRRRRVLLGKHATKTITSDNGTVVVEMGAEVTEEVLQRARLSSKFIELSMNVQ